MVIRIRNHTMYGIHEHINAIHVFVYSLQCLSLGSPILEANALEHKGVNDMNIVTRTIVIDRQGLELLGHVDHTKKQV